MRLLLIPLAAFLAILPLLLHGPSCGHDFDFHLLNWLEVNSQLHHLTWPQWAFTPAYNAGEPRFLFYPPLSWLVGATLTQILPFPLVPIAFTFLALTGAGFAMYRLAAAWVPPYTAVLAAIFYLLNPYTLFTAYERTAYAELLAAALFPFLMAGILAAQPRIPAIAIPLGLLWLTNAPAAVMGSYALAVLAMVRLTVAAAPRAATSWSWLPRSSLSSSLYPVSSPAAPWRLATTTFAATALGLALAAFYILPAAVDRRLVQIEMAVIPGMTPGDNFLFHHTGISEDALAHDAVLHTASVIACVLLALTAAALLVAWRRSRTGILLPLSVLAAVIAFLLTPLSLPFWTHTPELAFLQFPWRLLAVLAPVLALAGAVAARSFTLRPAVLTLAALGLCAILILPSYPRFNQACDPADTPQGRAALFHSPMGTEPTDEYTPRNADNDALHPPNASNAPKTDPPFWLIPLPAQPDAALPDSAPRDEDLVNAGPLPNPAAGLASGPAPSHLTLTLPAPEILVLNRREFPTWRVRLNGRIVQPLAPENPQREDGLLALILPAGHNAIELTQIHPPGQRAGLALSLAALLLLAVLLFWRQGVTASDTLA